MNWFTDEVTLCHGGYSLIILWVLLGECMMYSPGVRYSVLMVVILLSVDEGGIISWPDELYRVGSNIFEMVSVLVQGFG